MWKSKKDQEGPMDEIFDMEEEVVSHIPITRKKKEKVLLVLDLAVNIAIIIILVFIVRKFLISPFQVYGPSMCNTLNYFHEKCQYGFGEYIIVNKAVYQDFKIIEGEPHRGDIVVFRPPENESDFYIKRVIGLPGETVELRSGKVFVVNGDHPDGAELSEPYLSSVNAGNTLPYGGKKSFTVPENAYFVLGDNRRESTDSRTCFLAPNAESCKGDHYFLPQEKIEGKAWLVLWPFSNIRWLRNPTY